MAEKKEVAEKANTVKVEKKVMEKKAEVKEETKKVAKKPSSKVGKNSSKQYMGTGRRKKSIARVRLIANGNGRITINGRDIDDYFALDTLKIIAKAPLIKTEMANKYDVFVNIVGGGISGQAGAIAHGIARALVEAEENTKATLKSAGMLTRDAREKERKKYGLKKARKAPQFSKR